MDRRLYRACATGDFPQLEALVDGEPDIVNREAGHTLLHVAVQNGHLDIVRYLMEKKPELANKTYGEEELTPLHLAAIDGKTDIIRAILDRKLNYSEQKTKSGKNIFHLMVKHGQHKAFACTLLAYDLKELADKEDQDGNTVLHLSIRGGSIWLVKFIVEEQPLLTGKLNKGGKTALDVAIEEHGHHQWEQMFACLREAQCITRRELMRCLEEQMFLPSRFLKEQLDGAMNTMLVGAVLIATVAFSTLMNPPGGVYQDGPLAGKAILSTHTRFHVFFFFNVAALLTSLLMVIIRCCFISWKRITVRITMRLLAALMVASTLFICVDYVMAAWMIYRPGKMKTTSMIFLCTGVGATATAIISFYLYLKTTELIWKQYLKSLN